jgi:branched-chain amino acid transport system substrate-binding protein
VQSEVIAANAERTQSVPFSSKNMHIKSLATALILFAAINWSVAPTAAEDRPAKVGVIAPLSGAYASFGDQIKAGMELASGGKAKLIFEDSRFDTKTALAAYRKLTAIDKVDYLISAGGETCGVLNREAQKDRLLHIAVGCNTEVFNNPDSYSFRLDVNEAIAADELAKYLVRNHVGRIGVINIQNTWGTTVAKFALDAFAANTISVVDRVTFLPDEAGNLRTVLAKMQNAAPQRLFIVSSPETFASVLKQMAELHMQTPVVSTIAVEIPEFIELAGSLANGIVYLSVKNDPISAQKHPDFYARFPGKNTFTAWGFDAVTLLREANQHADPKEFLQTLRGFVGAYNVYNYDRSGELHFNYEMRTIKAGRYEPLE